MGAGDGLSLQQSSTLQRMHGTSNLRGLCVLLCVGLSLLVGTVQVRAACDCPAGAFVKAAGSYTWYAFSDGYDFGTAYSSWSGAANGSLCLPTSGGTPLVYPVKIREWNSGAGYPVQYSITSTDAANCVTNGGSLPGMYTNYSAVFCYTNKFATYLFWNPRQVFMDGSVVMLYDRDGDGLNDPLAPKQGVCMTLTNTHYFYIEYGDPVFASDEPGLRLEPATNAIAVAHPDVDNHGTPIQGGIVGNGAGPNQGGNAVGGTNPVQTIDLNRAADGIILALGQNNRALLDKLGQLASNSASSGEYSNVLESIRRATSNENALAQEFRDSMDVGALAGLVAATNARGTGSNGVVSGGLSGASGYSVLGSTGAGDVGAAGEDLVANLIDPPDSDWGIITVDTGLSGLGDFEIDFGGSVDGSSLNPYLGSGWRTWLRLIILWLTFAGIFIAFSQELRQGFADFCSSSQLQVNALTAGAGSLAPGVNLTARSVLVAGAVVVIALFPALIAVLISSMMGVVAGFGGPSTVGAAVSLATTAGSAGSWLGNVFTALNSMFPLVEIGVMSINYWVCHLLIDYLVAFLCFFFRIFGV